MIHKKKAIVTGGTAGIGKAIALLFARQGADVAIFGTNEQRAQEVLEELRHSRVSEEQEFRSVLADLSQTKDVHTAIEGLLSCWGQIDILVNNAGVTRDNLLMRMSEEDWDFVIDVNLKSVYNTCHALARSMMKAKKGKIINITSVIGQIGNAGQANYAASKAGVIGLTKSLAKEFASRNICVNCIAPGYIETKMTQGLSDSVKEGVLSKIPLGRIGQPDEIAYAALYLASDWANYLTGQVLTVDGGMVM